MNETEAERFWLRGWTAIREAAERQSEELVEQEPAQRFLDLIFSLLSSGRAHCGGSMGSPPLDRERWGWRREGDGDGWRACGDLVGWVDLDRQLFLLPEAAFRAVRQFCPEAGIAISLGTLKKRLHQRGLLQTTDERGGKTRLTVRRRLGGAEQQVLHIRLQDDAPTTEKVPIGEGAQRVRYVGIASRKPVEMPVRPDTRANSEQAELFAVGDSEGME